MRPLALTFSLAALALFATLSGCATPQYQTSVRLVPPTDAAGLQCVQGCETQKQACQDDCTVRYQACAKRIEPLVETRYTEALKLYERDLRQYARALQHYEMQLRFDWLYGYPFHHPYWAQPFPSPYFPPPWPEPVMPTREGVRSQLEKSSCQADCGCLPAYDACFVGCGGQRINETVCVQNCPPTH